MLEQVERLFGGYDMIHIERAGSGDLETIVAHSSPIEF